MSQQGWGPQGPYGQPGWPQHGQQGYGAYGMVPVAAAPMAPFCCRSCGYSGHAMVTQKVSAGGWVVFVLLLLFCFPLFWIGLLMKENRSQCPSCRVMV
jgi:hypothetical protein